MKRVELTILDRDADRVIEFLGRRALIHLSEDEAPRIDAPARNTADYERIRDRLGAVRSAAACLGIELPEEPDEASVLPLEKDDLLAEKIADGISSLVTKESEGNQEKRKVEETLNEARAFGNLNAPFSDLDQLSYLTLRVGRLDPKRQDALRENLADRAVVIPLGHGEDGGPSDRVLTAASRKGRFALDSELKRLSFAPISIPEGFTGIPAELLSGLEERLAGMDKALEEIAQEKNVLREEYGPALRRLAGSYLMALEVERLKGKLKATQSVYVLSGWIPADMVKALAAELGQLSEGRVAVRAFNPEEIPEIREGREKVPVSLAHGAFVKGFENVVFSYGAPLYGTIDPTPFVAFSFTLLFGIMFGDLGQGFVLLLLGLLTSKRGARVLSGFRHFSSPLIAVSISSMIMGILNGAVFANEELLVGPTQAVTGFFMRMAGMAGEPPERILHLMPEKGSVAKLFYFFGFTVAVGVVLNSIGLVVNIINLCLMKRYEKAFFSKTGVAGLLLFWYAIFIAVRVILGGRFAWFDGIGLGVPVFCVFFGPMLWRIIARKRPVFEEGVMVFVMEGFVEVLETASTYISNTVSFLRVGAFALSHAVLSFIVFTLSEMVGEAPPGPVFALIVMIFGNAVIIMLEGMIVAIQVVRLQYYEFFSKFFTETGVKFSPFRFRKGVES
jgi:V/A-type H+-transporting ATPase subunit I